MSWGTLGLVPWAWGGVTPGPACFLALYGFLVAETLWKYHMGMGHHCAKAAPAKLTPEPCSSWEPCGLPV